MLAGRVFRKVARVRRDLHLQSLYRKYKAETMLSPGVFVDNLRLVAPLAADGLFESQAVVECGTWRGGMSAALVELFGGGRPYAFFDSFAGLPPVQEIDGPAARAWQGNLDGEFYHDNCTASRAEFERTLAGTGVDPRRVHIHEGLFEDTVAKADIGPIAVLRLDGDWYGSTIACLEGLWDKVAPGGILIVDDYGVWDGCTRALHDFLSTRAAPEPIERFGTSRIVFLRKRSG